MAQEAHTRGSVSALEGSLLVLAAFFLTTAVLGWALGDPDRVGPWLALSVAPPLVLLAGAVIVRTGCAALYPVASVRAPLMTLSAGLLLIGGAGGILIGPTLPERLAPVLPAGWAAAWGLGWVGLAAPLVEEIYFRGTLQPALARHLRGEWAAVLAATAFALAHFGMPIFVLALMLSLGLCAGAAANVTRHVLPAIALHIGWNLGTVGSSFAAPGTLAAWPVALAVIGGLGVVIARTLRRQGGGAAW